MHKAAPSLFALLFFILSGTPARGYDAAIHHIPEVHSYRGEHVQPKTVSDSETPSPKRIVLAIEPGKWARAVNSGRTILVDRSNEQYVHFQPTLQAGHIIGSISRHIVPRQAYLFISSPRSPPFHA